MFSLPSQPKVLVEPFAGGGIISLTAAFEHLADSVVMVELDDQIAAVWQTILAGDAQWLAKRIMNFDLSPESAQEIFLISSQEPLLPPNPTRMVATFLHPRPQFARVG
jgi:site-specific DNA-adenine methylase